MLDGDSTGISATSPQGGGSVYHGQSYLFKHSFQLMEGSVFPETTISFKPTFEVFIMVIENLAKKTLTCNFTINIMIYIDFVSQRPASN